MPLALETAPGPTLAPAYRRLAGLCDALAVRVAAPGGGPGRPGPTTADLVLDPCALDAFVDAEADRIRARHGVTVRRDVAASRALHDYVWSVALLMSGVWYLERRVPRIRPEDVRPDLGSCGYTVTPGTAFACLPGDPAAGLPGVLTLPHEEALRHELRSAVADHMRPLLDTLGPVVRRGPRALWGMVADDLVSGVWYLGRTLGREEEAVRAAGELLPAAVAPYPGGAAFRSLTGEDGRRHLTRTRTGCCLFYAVRPAESCLTCPRTSDEERLRRLGTR
ncbi:(2Fe-2S)-binding protein [Streptomyces sp. NPDC006739]|uniref:(2Fe-2S)-binding protein n=1 Tax=Streptomyces sp. NPDC006739 TaxID=3364763 RepID=UPI0036D1EDEC